MLGCGGIHWSGPSDLLHVYYSKVPSFGKVNKGKVLVPRWFARPKYHLSVKSNPLSGRKR
jgi:hypothetical protein